jgi:hypothetical protein
MHSPHSDAVSFTFELRDAFGTTSKGFAMSQLDHITRTVENRGDGKVDMNAVNGVLALVHGIQPENEVEAALAVQIALTHHMAAKMLCQASLSGRSDHSDRYFNLATKLQRTMVAQIEVLARLKGRGDAAPIGAVTVTDGGQAIVGGTVNIDARRGETSG